MFVGEFCVSALTSTWKNCGIKGVDTTIQKYVIKTSNFLYGNGTVVFKYRQSWNRNITQSYINKQNHPNIPSVCTRNCHTTQAREYVCRIFVHAFKSLNILYHLSLSAQWCVDANKAQKNFSTPSWPCNQKISVLLLKSIEQKCNNNDRFEQYFTSFTQISAYGFKQTSILKTANKCLQKVDSLADWAPSCSIIKSWCTVKVIVSVVFYNWTIAQQMLHPRGSIHAASPTNNLSYILILPNLYSLWSRDSQSQS